MEDLTKERIKEIYENHLCKRILTGSIVAPMSGFRIIPYPEWERNKILARIDKRLDKESKESTKV